MDVSSPATLSTPAGDIAFNSDGDSFIFLKLDGFDAPELRVTVDNKSRQDGAVVHSIYAAALSGTCEGWCMETDPATRRTAEIALAAALASIWAADGTFTQGSRSLTVRNNVELHTAIVQGVLHSFQFGLVAADPNWS